jgi:hypothetical protein
MKKFLFALMAAVSIAHSQATVLTLNGSLTWNVTEPRCTFKLNGKLVNNTAQGSGTLKLLLYATQTPFPSPGFLVSEATLGVVGSGFQFSSFTVSAASKVPSISGSYIFTVVVSEYDGANWRNVLAIPGGTRTLAGGDFTGQQKWSLPTAPVQPSVAKLAAGNILRLTVKATNELNQFPATFQERADLFIDAKGKLTRKYRGVRAKASYSLKTKNAQYNGTLASCGVLTVKYSATANATVTLFFQGTNSGTYKSVEVKDGDTATTWGTFKLL